MASKEQVWSQFWDSFSIPSYDESTVPDDATFPRITHNLVLDSFGYPVLMTASVWYYSTSWEAISQKVQEIADRIGYGGTILPYDGGYLWLKRGRPFAQRMVDENDAVRRVYMNFEADWLSAD